MREDGAATENAVAINSTFTESNCLGGETCQGQKPIVEFSPRATQACSLFTEVFHISAHAQKRVSYLMGGSMGVSWQQTAKECLAVASRV
jgi:hypothetical protein